jgi:hypothetical protein
MIVNAGSMCKLYYEIILLAQRSCGKRRSCTKCISIGIVSLSRPLSAFIFSERSQGVMMEKLQLIAHTMS